MLTYAPAIIGGGILFQLGTVLLGPLFTSLVFGAQYLPSIPLLYLLSFLIPLKALYAYFYQGVVLAGGEKIQFVFPLAGVLTNIVLDVLLIPSWGPYGAATASVFSFLLASILLLLYLRRWTRWSGY